MVEHVKDEREKEVLLGVHKRDYRNNGVLLAENPSKLDYKTLNEAYKAIRYELLIQLQCIVT